MDTDTFGKLRELPLKGITLFCKKKKHDVIRVKTCYGDGLRRVLEIGLVLVLKKYWNYYY